MFSTVRRGFWFAAVLCLVIEALSLAPIVYMWNAFDRVLSSRSLITLVSLTVLILGVYLFWSAMEWVRSRLMVRLSLRIDWELAAEVFDASFRRHAGRKDVNVQQVMSDLLELRQFLAGKGVILVRQKKYSGAREAYEQALAVNPTLEQVKDALKALDRLEQGI